MPCAPGKLKRAGVTAADRKSRRLVLIRILRTKATLIYRRTKNLRALQLLLGHTKLDYVPCGTMSCSAELS